MKPEFFWINWKDPYKKLYRILLFILLGSILFYAFTYVSGNSFLISWEIVSIINPVKTLFKNYHLGLYSFPIYVDNYVVQQSFEASELQIHEWPAYILLIWLGVFLSFMLTLITDLSRFWFVVSVVLFTLLLIGLKLDYLVLFNQYSKVGLMVAFVLYYPTLYVFHFVKKDFSFLKRLGINLVATILFALIIYKFSHVNIPFLHLANYGIYVPLILTIIFTFMIGHEIISGLLRVIASGDLTGDKNGIYHFLIISVVYLLNVGLLLLKNTRTYDTNIYLMGAFLLLTLASIVGIWGYKSRRATYQGMFAFFPQGAFLYLLMAITAHLTLAYFFMTGNDFLVEVIEDAIVFSQLAYGVMFIVYFLANFYDLFRQNKEVIKVLYKPMRMPYFTSRLAGLIAILGLFFKFNMTPYNQAVAGFYSGVGDLYLHDEDYLSAREYYNISTIYSGTSHRANYAMATMERRNSNTEEEIRYLKQAIEKNPTEFAFANLAARQREKQQYFAALFTLQDGLEEFPESGPLMNNLALVYQDLHSVDSAFYHLNNAIQFQKSEKEAEANIYGLLRMEDLSIKKDTLHDLLAKTTSLPAINNLVVLSNELGIKTDDRGSVEFGEPEQNQIDQIVYNYNKILNEPVLTDSALLEDMRIFYDSGNTSWFRDNIYQATALALYEQNDLSAAFERLNLLAYYNPEDTYNTLLARLSFSWGAAGLSVDYFKKSFQEGYLEVAPELAFAYMENNEFDKAIFLWRQILASGDSSNRITAQQMIEVIEANSIDDIQNADAETKISFIKYRIRAFDIERMEALALSLENEDAQALAFIKLLDINIELERQNKAIQNLEKIGELNISLPHVLEEINLAQCRYAYHFQEREVMDRMMDNLKSNDPRVNNFLDLFTTLNTTDSLQATQNYIDLAEKNPFFEPGVMEAVEYLNQNEKKFDKAYEILLNAVNLNPFSIALNKAYAIQSIMVGLDSYAYETKEELKQMMNSVAFESFEKEFEEALTRYDVGTSDWEK